MTMDEILTAFKVAGMDELYLDAVRLAYIAGYRSTHTWVGLTDADMAEKRTQIFDFIDGARWAEAKLKERNT
jgi:hypothetical protein